MKKGGDMRTGKNRRALKALVQIRKGKKPRKVRDSRIAWGDVDWAKQDVVISREMGCSRERVRQKRRELGVGRAERHHRLSGTFRDRIEGMPTSGKTLKEISGEVGCKPAYAMMVLHRAKQGWVRIDRRLPLKYDWGKADWTMTDREVALALGVPNHGVVSQYRFRHGIRKRPDVVGVGVKGALRA